MKEFESKVKIYKTSEYSKFSFIPGNRPISEKKVSSYAQMIVDGYPQEEAPILVTEKLEILDGQHRLMAARRMGTPVAFIISQKSADSSAMVDINKGASSWKIEDYVQYFSHRGNIHYTRLHEFCKSNTISLGMGMICLGYPRGYARKIVVGENFRFSEEKKVSAEIWIQRYRDFLSRAACGNEPLFKIAASSSFLEAVILAKNKKDTLLDVVYDNSHVVLHASGLLLASGYKGYLKQFASLGCCDFSCRMKRQRP